MISQAMASQTVHRDTGVGYAHLSVQAYMMLTRTRASQAMHRETGVVYAGLSVQADMMSRTMASQTEETPEKWTKPQES